LLREHRDGLENDGGEGDAAGDQLSVLERLLDVLERRQVVVLQVGAATLQLEELERVLVAGDELGGQQDGGDEDGGVGLSVDAVRDDRVLRILLQEPETLLRRLENDAHRRRRRRLPAALDDDAGLKLCDVVASLGKVDDGVVIGVAVLDDAADIIDVVPEGQFSFIGPGPRAMLVIIVVKGMKGMNV